MPNNAKPSASNRVSSFGGLPINMFGFNTYLLVNFSREGLIGLLACYFPERKVCIMKVRFKRIMQPLTPELLLQNIKRFVPLLKGYFFVLPFGLTKKICDIVPWFSPRTSSSRLF